MAIRIAHTGQRGQPRTLKTEADLRLLTSIPPHPAYFDANRASIWNEYAELLIARGDLSQGDLAVLENFTCSLAEYREIGEQLAKSGRLVETPKGLFANPLCNLRRQAEMQMTVAAASLGLSPRGRAAMKREAKADTSQPEETKKASAF